MIAISLVGCTNATGTQGAGSQITRPTSASISSPNLQRWWRHISTAGHGIDPAKYKLRTDYWSAVLYGPAYKVTTRALESPHYRQIFQYWLDRFCNAKSKPKADFRLLFSAPDLLMPLRGGPTNNARVKINSKQLPPSELTRRRLAVCRQEVVLLLHHPQCLRRYYHAVVWSGLLFPGGSANVGLALGRTIDETQHGFKRATKDEYWWWARNVIILLYATNRVDMLNGVEPNHLKMVFGKWVRWAKAHNYLFRAEQSTY